MRRLGLFLVLVSAVGCPSVFRQSDRTFLSNRLAEHTYLEAEYEHSCVPTDPAASVGSRIPACKKTQAAIREFKRELDVASRVAVLGAMPADERKQIRAAAKAAKVKP